MIWQVVLTPKAERELGYSFYDSACSSGTSQDWIANPVPLDEYAWVRDARSSMESLFSGDFDASASPETLYTELPSLKYAQIDRALNKLKTYLHIQIHTPEEVLDYLIRYQDIFYLVLYGCNLAYHRFKDRAQLTLEVSNYHTPYEYLALYVRQESYDPDLLKQIDQICEVFEQEFKTKNGWFIITTDLCTSR